ncbi:MAG: HDOD domain-containing protein [Pseudomonadota bacterium]
MLKWLAGLFGNRAREAASPEPAATAPTDPPPPPPFLRREALLDRDGQASAYAFGIETPASHQGHAWHGATRKFFDGVLIDHFANGHLDILLERRLAFLPLGPAGLVHPRIGELPRRNLAIEFVPPPGGDFDPAAALARLAALHEDGFQIACAPTLETGPLRQLPGLASHLILDGTGRQAPPDLLALCHRLARDYPAARLVARDVDSMELFEAGRKMGIHLFQGPFLTQRQGQPGNRIAPYRMFVVKLLNGLREQAEFEDLAAIAWCDPALGYRLLNFVNSAAFGLREKIDRLSRAMAYVGRDELLRWLTLLLFTSQDPDPLDDALRENALVRARLAETLAEKRVTRRERDEIFVVGILSVIDALLQIPMAEALASLNLPDPVKEALLARQGKYAPYLNLAIACEDADQAAIQTQAGELGMDALAVNQQHIQALAWTMDFLDTLA